MSKSSEAVKKWRKATKERIVTAMGGKCQCCGYDRCNNSLDLHHIDPNEKELSFGKIRANPKSWIKIVEELKKCILVCRNCHGEIHANVKELPKQYAKFDESFSTYYVPKNAETTYCPICSKPKTHFGKFCSLSCSGKSRRRVNWDDVNLLELIKSKNPEQIGDTLGVSGNAVRKRLKKLATRSGADPL